MTDYEISLLFEKVETQILKNLTDTFKDYIADDAIKNLTKNEWKQFRMRALQGLRQFKKENANIFNSNKKKLLDEMEKNIRNEYKKQLKISNRQFLKMQEKGIIDDKYVNLDGLNNTRRLKAIVKELRGDTMRKAEYAMLRQPEDIYKKIINGAQLYQNTASTVWEAVDYATNEFAKNGITTIRYKNGANVNIASWSEMAIRTNDARVANAAQGDLRDEYGIPPLVMISSYGACSPTCLPWQGKVYLDDVWGDVTKEIEEEYGEKYELLSMAIDGGLFHPNCRHSMSTYYEGISRVRKEERSDKEISETYKAEQQQRSIERDIRKQKRLENACLTEEGKKLHEKKIRELNEKMKQHIATTNKQAGKEILRRDSAREKLR